MCLRTALNEIVGDVMEGQIELAVEKKVHAAYA